MLFYSRIKREFSQAVWKRGLLFCRDERVKSVKMDGDRISARVSGLQKELFETWIEARKGVLTQAHCACGEHPPSGRYCEHVAALSAWIIERGSLLRSGLVGESTSDDSEEEEQQEPEAVQAESVTYVRGMFEQEAFVGLSIEPAVRYLDPISGKPILRTLNRLIPQLTALQWRTIDGVYLELDSEEIPVLGSVNAPQSLKQGQAGLDLLAELLQKKNRKRLAFHEQVELEFEADPLRLTSMEVGRKAGKARRLSYEFRNQLIRLNSVDLDELSKKGRLTDHHVWKGRTVYRFAVPLNLLARFTHPGGGTTKSKQNKDAPESYTVLQDDPDHPLHPIAVYRLQLELGVEKFQVDPEWKEFHEWKKLFERKRYPALPDVEYGFDLRDYQKNGLSWMWSLYHRGLGAFLADDMGLGKTHQVMAFLSSLYKEKKGRPTHPTLVVAPTSVVAAWAQKLQKYPTGLKWVIFHGKQRKLPADTHLVLTTYGILQREPLLRERDWHVVVLDEAQAIKNASTLSARASRVLKSKFRVVLTGTPIENQSADLWSTMEFLLPGYLGSLPRFKRLYGSGREQITQDQASGLKRLVSPFLLRRTKKQVLTELPEKIEQVLICEMTPAQKKAYRACLSSAEAAKARENLQKEEKIDYANILALLTRLKQICNHPRLADITAGRVKNLDAIDPMDSGKWETVEELLKEALGSDLKTVIFTQYLGTMDLIGHYLKKEGIGYTELRGDTPDRAKRLDRFAEDPECKVFLCSLLAGGLGIDLTAGSVCIHFDRWWNPAKENQATDRLHRMGQTRGVQVFKMQVPNSVEDRIATILESKMALSDALIEESGLGLKAFSRDQLLQLLSPSSMDGP